MKHEEDNKYTIGMYESLLYVCGAIVIFFTGIEIFLRNPVLFERLFYLSIPAGLFILYKSIRK